VIGKAEKMKANYINSKSAPTPRLGFTLVEMLVSVSLVLLMMTMFATIFQIATGSMNKQRGIAELDQKARVLSTVVRKDFQHRTFRNVLPFYPGEDSAISATTFSNRSGYIYISTNNPYTGLDDLIQLTVSANVLAEDPDSTPYFGRAAELSDRKSTGAVFNGLQISPNQPEADDGSYAANSVASSPYAEICYFIRNGSLYRSIMLIREPLSVAGQNFGSQPTATSGYNYFSGQPNSMNAATYDGLFKVVDSSFQPDGAAGTLTNDFGMLFDHSAYAVNFPGNQSAAFLGSDSLSNETAGAASEVFGNPGRRMGFNPQTSRSREHTVSNSAGIGPAIFFGRFTRAETSSLNFNWPQNTSREELVGQLYSDPDSANFVGVDFDFDGTVDFTSTNGNPLDLVATPLTLNPATGVVSSFDTYAPSVMDPITTRPVQGRGGPRRVEDLLLSNVHEMKIELWDARLQRFAVPGHFASNGSTGELGDYARARCLNPNSGPDFGSNSGAVFDTWHFKNAAADYNGNGSSDVEDRVAPYIPYVFYPPRQNAVPPGPSATTMPPPPFPVSYWTSGAGTFTPGQTVIFAPVTFDGDGAVEVFEWDGDGQPAIVGLTRDAVPSQAFQIAYRCVAVNDINGMNGIETGALQPIFPTAPGRRFTDNEVTWESFDNRRPLEAIRLTFRFQDKKSDNMRQLSLVIPLTK